MDIDSCRTSGPLKGLQGGRERDMYRYRHVQVLGSTVKSHCDVEV